MSKKSLSERDICTKFITPGIEKGGWDVMVQVREDVHLANGRVIVRGELVSCGTANLRTTVLCVKPNAAAQIAWFHPCTLLDSKALPKDLEANLPSIELIERE